MSKFYVVKTIDAVDGIEGLPVVQEQISMRNGAPPVAGEVARSRDPMPVSEYSKWDGEALAEMTPDECTVWDNHLTTIWQVSETYQNRYKATRIIAGIQAILTGLGITAVDKAQVFTDVDAMVQAARGTETHVTMLETAMRVQTYFLNLTELVGDTTGLINGSRTLNLDK